MITSPVQHLDENDDEDLDMLRKIAIESLKRGRENEFPQEQYQNIQPVFPNQPELISYENNEVPYQNGPYPGLTRPQHRMPGNPHYMRPRFNNFGPRHPARPFMQRGIPHHFPPQPVIPDFVPIPHVNPQFLTQHPVQQPQIFPPIVNEFPIDYVPTPAIRLSPRSAEFIAANEQAMKKASSKRYSRSPPARRRRSRSGSPIRRRSRTRSPYKRRSPIENSRKRYRSKSPENRLYKSRNNSPKVDKRSKSPQNRSQSPRNARFARRGRDNNRYNNGSNGNGRYNRKRSESDKEDEKPEQNRSQSKPKEESVKVKEVDSKEKIEEKKEVKVEKTKSLTPAAEEKSTTPPLLPIKKEKTEQELEDELLASTDEEEGDQLDINMDDNELDFLEDDSESENEGRFKSKPSANIKTASSLPSKHNTGNSRSYDKGRYSNRHDYKRDDKYSHSKRRDHSNRKNSPDLDTRRKSPTERKPIFINKDKDDVKSSTESERKPMFKSTFKSVVESGDKKAESATTKKSDSRPALVRSYVNKPDVVVEKKSSSMKSVLTSSEESSSKTGKKKIMDRLGEFVGAKKNDGNRSRASKQVDEQRKVIYRMKSTVEMKFVASRNSYVST